MKVTIHQPSFLPWLGLLDKIAKSELFVFLDDVSANKASNQYRNVFYCNGEAKHISLPVDYRHGIKINDLNFKNEIWRAEHLNKIQNYYSKAKYFDEIFPYIIQLYNADKNITPCEFIKDSMIMLFQLFKIEVLQTNSSDLKCSESKGELVFEICSKINATTYISGKGGLNYMTENVLNDFEKAKIKIEWHSFSHPFYDQSTGHEFVEGLSSLDLLFFQGIENSRKLFWSNIK